MNNTRLLQFFIFFTCITISLSEEDVDYIQCGNLKCAKNQGTCQEINNDYLCICDEHYATYPFNNDIVCNYERKKQLNAFLLEFFVTYGAGHFYTENYKYAIPKLLVFVFLYCLFIVLRIISKAKEENKTANLLICIFAAVCFVGMITWQLIDVFKYGYNKYKDGNGIELFPM